MKFRPLLLLGAVLVVLFISGISYQLGYHHPSKMPTKTVTKAGTYVALGDSIAAGAGLETYSDASACGRTQQSYPNAVATHFDYVLTSYACSGASIPEGLTGSQDVNDLQEMPQLDGLLKGPKPKLVTISVGANDISWVQLITVCITGTCNTDGYTNLADSRIGQYVANLGTVLDKIKKQYPTDPPRVVLVGYYGLFNHSELSCSDATGIDADEADWINGQLKDLNTATADVARTYSFTTFATPNFNGHELCSSDPWIQSLGDRAAYHPTDAGQAAIAKATITAAAK